MKTFAEFPRWRGLKDDALAWEVYTYLVDTRSGLFHCNEVLEGDDALNEYRRVRDPVKIINVYGYAYCDILGPTMAGIWEDMTGNQARTVTLPKWAHVAAEAFYAGKWHYMDIDVRAVFRRPDERVRVARRGPAQRWLSAATGARCSSPRIPWRARERSTSRPRWKTPTGSTRAAIPWTTCSARARPSRGGGRRRAGAGTIAWSGTARSGSAA